MAEKRDILVKLDEIAGLKAGDPMPDWLPVNDWARPLSQLAADAAKEIRELRNREI